MFKRYLILIFLLSVLPVFAGTVLLHKQTPKLDYPKYLHGNVTFAHTLIAINDYRLRIYKQYGHHVLGWIGVKYSLDRPHTIISIFSGSYLLNTIVKPGDLFLAINGISVEELPIDGIRPDRLAGNIERITVLHHGSVIDLPIVLMPLDDRYRPIYYH
jgi:hypothetical protein